ncbi:MAG: hypothetical protein AAFY57_07380 [Cyanobacteria bacterium J06642_2]
MSVASLEKLAKAVDRLSEASQETVADVLAAVDRNSASEVFLTRSLQALLPLMEAPGLAAVASAPTDVEVLLHAIMRPEVLGALTQRDPLAKAKLRGILAKKELLEAKGGSLSSTEVGALLGISRQAVDKRRREGKLIALPAGRSRWRYPGWQFADNRVLPGLTEVLQAMPIRDAWMQAAFMMNGDARLGGASPLDVLRAGDADSVLIAAQMYGEHGAA